MSKPPSSKAPFAPSGLLQVQRTAVGEIIRRAEKSIAGQEYLLARELLQEAGRLDPGNPYIAAIAERVQILQGLVSEFAAQRNGNGGQPLSTSVGKDFPDGIRPSGNDDLRRGRIQRFLTVATTLFERGSYQSAYECIVKAEELDPHDSDVQTLKAKILPLYEVSLTRRSAGISGPARRDDSGGAAASMAGRLLAEDQRGTPGQEGNALPTFKDRLEELRRRKETERLARERALWNQSTQKRDSSRHSPPSSRQTKSSFISTLLRTMRDG